MTNRKFYKTIIPLEFLSEEPIGERDISELLEEATTGDMSMRVLESQETVLNGKEAAEALSVQASDPSFFNLTPDGDDEEERCSCGSGLFNDKGECQKCGL